MATLYKTNNKTIDRYKIPLSHIVRDDGIWIQEHLISKGLAWATITGTNRRMLTPLFLVEEEARTSRQGFWATPIYDIKTPTTLKNYINSYQIVEGKALYSSLKKGAVFFHFSKDWKTDFTMEIPRKCLSRFNSPSKLFNPRSWLNRVIRVRGWVKEKNGPMIMLKYREQVELVN